jgi:hypothetical protein
MRTQRSHNVGQSCPPAAGPDQPGLQLAVGERRRRLLRHPREDSSEGGVGNYTCSTGKYASATGPSSASHDLKMTDRQMRTQQSAKMRWWQCGALIPPSFHPPFVRHIPKSRYSTSQRSGRPNKPLEAQGKMTTMLRLRRTIKPLQSCVCAPPALSSKSAGRSSLAIAV